MVAHVGKVQPRDQVVAVEPSLPRNVVEGAGQIVEGEEFTAVTAQAQRLGAIAAVKEDGDGDDPIGLAQLGQVQAIVGEAMDREAVRLALLLERGQKRRAASIGPLEQQRHVQFPEAVAEPIRGTDSRPARRCSPDRG